MLGSLFGQRAKALGLTILMVMLAQSAYTQYFQGWQYTTLEDQQDAKFVDSATCLSVTRGSGAAINVDVVNGNDSYAGTSDCPMKSLSAAVNSAVNNDEIIMHSGLYHDNVSINGIDNLVIRAATGATPGRAKRSIGARLLATSSATLWAGAPLRTTARRTRHLSVLHLAE